MDIDPSDEQKVAKSEVLRDLSTKGPLRSSLSKLSGSSRVIPAEKDFHFYNNFQEFKAPVDEIDEKSKTLLQLIGSSEAVFSKRMPFPDDKAVELDDDVALDWLVAVNDETFERLDISLDEFKTIRKGEEETGVRVMKSGDVDEDGFQMVYGKKKNKTSLGGSEKAVEVGSVQEVKVATKAKPKVPFHVPKIPRPQDEYKIIVNNANQPFEHVWLQKSEDGSRFLHPLEKLAVLDFIDGSDSNSEPLKPPPLDATPFKFVEDVKELKQLAIKLRNVDEFAVDLEHNQYRSFQGMTCLMQISTRTEDFIIDTLKLRIHVGPYLRELFKDPNKRKVMHGADRDIFWLQRDFGIYVCNMFDTGQASRVLKMERYSLEYLLNHICGVEANKEYQNADWRIRPLPREMIKYAREDTHYLLYIYDVMRRMLLTSSIESDSSDPPLVEVYKRSYDLCIQLYEKELLTDSSYQYIYGVQGSGFNAQQLAIVSGLCEWRDGVARAEDESTGYVLPNRTLIEIAKQMPLSIGQLRRLLKSRHPYIERNLDSVVSIIRHSIHNAAAFEDVAKQLKERRSELANRVSALSTEESEILPSETPDISLDTGEDEDLNDSISPANHANEAKTASVRKEALPGKEQLKTANTNLNSANSAVATVQMLKKPTPAFGAMLGASKRKFDSDRSGHGASKLEHIKSTVSLPFHTFQGKTEDSSSKTEEPGKNLASQKDDVPLPAMGSTLEDVIILDDDDDDDDAKEEPTEEPSADQLENENEPKTADSSSEIDEEDEPMSLSDLTSSFQKVLPSPDQTKSSRTAGKSQGLLNFKPFDYDAAREQIKFGQHQPRTRRAEEDKGVKGKKDGNKSSATAQSAKDAEGTPELLQGKRRMAFPSSGNRSASFR